MSVPAQRALWAALGGLFGPLAGLEVGRGGLAEAGLAGAALGAALALQLSRALPIFGVAVGPLVALTLMNLQRFSAADPLTPAPVARRGAQATPAIPSLSYVSTGIGIVASALLASVLLHGLSRKLRGERRPLRASLRSLAWICLWITLAMVLISNFAPL